MKETTLKLSDIGEKALIDRIIEKSQYCSDFNNKNSNSYSTAIGDDSALTDVSIDADSYMVSSSDMLIQSTHFPKIMSYYQMGFKSVAVNISDLIAMGAEPVGFLLNIAVPKGMLLDDFDELVCGVVGACDYYNMPLIGGDTNEANEIIISGTALGKVEKDKALMKYGFEVGDLVCVSGELGLAALGFEILSSEESYELASKTNKALVDLAVFKALKPTPDYANGRILANLKSDYNISATDITDGLASELYEILNADRKCSEFNNGEEIYSKGIRIYEDKLPVEGEFKEISKALDLDYLDLFLHIGEDFELLFTIPKSLEETLKNRMDFHAIGEIIEENTVEIVLSNGKTKIISPKGYEHLSK
ncbi:MAG: thiamine-phosphate kinase [Methanobrevibacter sp.]|nr:thiamine-phosphate kinase [Methanobrevibacter sp.]